MAQFLPTKMCAVPLGCSAKLGLGIKVSERRSISLRAVTEGAKMTTSLDQLAQHSIIVADSGNFEDIAKYKPQDSTTNPSLILKAVQSGEPYVGLVEQAVATAKAAGGSPEEMLQAALDETLVLFGCKVLDKVPGRVSTEMDARYSDDAEATFQQALRIVELYKKHGIDPEKRVLIKIASTWAGGEACTRLEALDTHCNMTLLFAMPQAWMCAQAKSTIISPFIGRITDYQMKEAGTKEFPPLEQDNGILNTKAIIRFYADHAVGTKVMGASFRHKGQVTALAGSPLLTVSPALLEELSNQTDKVEQAVDATPVANPAPLEELTKEMFDEQMGADAMATFKLREGIDKFSADTLTLENMLKEMLA